MQLEVSAEVLLSQLGYSLNNSSLRKAQKIIDGTKNFHKFSKHLFSLNDHLKRINAYIAISNSTNHLKIKCDEFYSKEIINEFNEEVANWANKYNLELEKLNNKLVYYILGTK